MKTKIVRIGNSQGIRIPKVVLDQCHIYDDVEMETKEDCIIIKSSHAARDGWAAAFQKMHENMDDTLLIDDGLETVWDGDEWEW
ncbi:MAG: AbrB/MazE/SpoVT family DNA-binding domain-containing protein [Nitrospira sp.]|nr:AbrB/MazE/SpoVT family DNA-binding domain-containing protein [Nitrospira sp.]